MDRLFKLFFVIGLTFIHSIFTMEDQRERFSFGARTNFETKTVLRKIESFIKEIEDRRIATFEAKIRSTLTIPPQFKIYMQTNYPGNYDYIIKFMDCLNTIARPCDHNTILVDGRSLEDCVNEQRSKQRELVEKKQKVRPNNRRIIYPLSHVIGIGGICLTAGAALGSWLMYSFLNKQ